MEQELDALRADTRRLLEEGGKADELRERLTRVARRGEARDFLLLEEVLKGEGIGADTKHLVTALILDMEFPRALLVDPDALDRFRRYTRRTRPVLSFSLATGAVAGALAQVAFVVEGWVSVVFAAPWVLGIALATFPRPKTRLRRLGQSLLRIFSAVCAVGFFGFLYADSTWLHMHGDDALFFSLLPFVVLPISGLVLASRSAALGKALPDRTR